MSTTTLGGLLNPTAAARTHVDVAKVKQLARRATPGLPEHDPAAPQRPEPQGEGAAARVSEIVEAAITYGALTLPAGVAVAVSADVDDDGEGVYVMIELAAVSPVKLTLGWRDVGEFTLTADQYSDVWALAVEAGSTPLAAKEAVTRSAYYDTITAAAAVIDALLGQTVEFRSPAEIAAAEALVAAVDDAYEKAAADDRALMTLALDDLVHDAAASVGAGVNNAGVVAQVAYLTEHEGAAAAAALIAEACDLDGVGGRPVR